MGGFYLLVIFMSCIEESMIRNVGLLGFGWWGWICLVFLKASVQESEGWRGQPVLFISAV